MADTKTPDEKRQELARLAHEVPELWLDDLIRAAKHGPQVLDSAYSEPLIPDAIDQEIEALEDALLQSAWRMLNVQGPSYEIGRWDLDLQKYGLSWGGTTLEEFAEAGGFDAAAFAGGVVDALREWDAEWAHQDENQEFYVPRVNVIDEQAHQVRGAALSMLRNHGILRGPCKRCGRTAWLTRFRSGKVAGRPPLALSYCPTCVEAIKREQSAARMRKAYAQKQASRKK